MLRKLAILGVAVWFGVPAIAAEPEPVAPRPLESAFHAMKAGRWDRAFDLAERAGPGAIELVEWTRLQGGSGTIAEVLAFLRLNPDWPRLDAMRLKYEIAFSAAEIDEILEFYSMGAPQTGIGVLSYARALRARDKVGEAEAAIVLAWRTMDLTTAEHNAFLKVHKELVEPHHAARLDMTVWRRLKDAQLMLPLVGKDHRKVIEARRGVEKGGKDPAKLPKELRQSAHVAFAEFNKLIRANKGEDAIKLILRQSRIAEGLGDGSRWAGWRRAMARTQMREGNHKLAYELASIHQLDGGASYADLEWLSGYLALRFLDQPELALDHFQRFRAAVKTPISLGRAGYWIGRAQEAMGDVEAARITYGEGALYQTSFYGLLAAERGDIPVDPHLNGLEDFGRWQDHEVLRRPITQAAVLAYATGRVSLAEQFVTHMARTMDRDALGPLAKMLDEMGAAHLQVMLGKKAARRGIVLHAPYYALHPMARETLPVPAELALTIARRESEFDPGVVSGAGAQGLMQVMPGTAKEVARDLGVDYQRDRVLNDWRYNVRLGSTYLAQLAEWFDGNVVLMSVGYNAGPGRARQWIERFGDPRDPDVDIVDWIEHIPFNETQNYVMRVAESLPIYRARLGEVPHPVPFTQLLKDDTIKPVWREAVRD